MASHLSTIGFTTENEEEIEELILKACEKGKTIKTQEGEYIKWALSGGIEVYVLLDNRNTVVGFNPHFAGTARMKVGLTERVKRPGESELEGAFHGWADPLDTDPTNGEYPFVFDLPDFRTYDHISLPSIITAQIAAFAHELSVYPDDKAFEESQPDDIKFAPESFVPSGIFQSDDENSDANQSFAMIAGHVLETSMLINPFSNAEFYWSKVRTLGGELDALSDPEVLNGKLLPGAVVYGTFWLSGRLVTYPPKNEKSFWKNIFNSMCVSI
jgi:hypothetical protein